MHLSTSSGLLSYLNQMIFNLSSGYSSNILFILTYRNKNNLIELYSK